MYMHFSDDLARGKEKAEDIRSAVEKSGVSVKRLVVSGDNSHVLVAVSFGQIKTKAVVTLEIDNLESLTVSSVFGETKARWEPSFGSNVEYIG
jgi:hypothetical protein